MNATVFISASARYIALYDMHVIVTHDNTQRILMIEAQQANVLEKKHLDYFHHIIRLPTMQIDGEPNMRFSYDEVAHVFLDLRKKYQTLKIVCIDEGNVLLAAKLRETFDIAGPRPAIVGLFSDKAAMYALLEKSNIAHPKSLRLQKTHQSFEKIKSELGVPFIVKPCASSGAFGVALIKTAQAWHEFNFEHDNFEYLASEYIQGDLFHCDIQIYKKEILFAACGLYLNPLLEFVSGKNSGSILLQEGDSRNKAIIHFCQHILLDVIQVDSGSFHVELFYRNGEWIFLEAAYRPAGAGLIQLYQQCVGVNLCDTDYFIQVGEKPLYGNQFDVRKNFFLVVAPTMRGKLDRKICPALNSQSTVDWKFECGQSMPAPQSIADKALVMFAANKDYMMLYQDYVSLKSYSFFTVVS